jgi:hypothetical protein
MKMPVIFTRFVKSVDKYSNRFFNILLTVLTISIYLWFKQLRNELANRKNYFISYSKWSKTTSYTVSLRIASWVATVRFISIPMKKYNRKRSLSDTKEKEIQLQSWEEHKREDLQMIPEMEKKGWNTKFSSLDWSKGRIHPWIAPLHPVEFIKENVICYLAVGRYTKHIEFKVVDIIGDKFLNLRTYPHLKDVIASES